MSEAFTSPFFGVALSVAAYALGMAIQRKTRLVVCNPLVIATLLIIAVLVVFDIPYEDYNQGGTIINLFLGPATACLAVTIYSQKELLKKNLLPILAGCLAGTVTAVFSILGMCRLFGLDDQLTISLLPKSVTTPIATAISEGQGGIVAVTVAGRLLHRHHGQSLRAAAGESLPGQGPGGGRSSHRRLQPLPWAPPRPWSWGRRRAP